MSIHADPSKAFVWLEGDGFRAPAGTARPTNPFADNPVTGSLAWDAFGGIEAGFDVTATRAVKTLPVWNRRLAPYKVNKDPREDRVKLRAVDYSVATVLTALEGGSVVETPTSSGVYEWHNGSDEEFALLLTVHDEGKSVGFYSGRVTLTTPPPRTFGKAELDGFEIELLALEPFIPLTSFNPLVTVATVTIGGTPTGGTFTLTFGGQTTAGIAYNAATSAVQSALVALSSIGAGNAVVTGSVGAYVVTIQLPGHLTGSGTSLTPSGTVTIS